MWINRFAGMGWGCLLCGLASGCALTGESAKSLLQPNNEIEERRETALEGFEARQDQLSLDAAQSRFDTGDAPGAQLLLSTLLERSPDYLPARLLLAEVTLAEGDLPEAELILRELAAAEPRRAIIQHMLGTVLELNGEPEAAAVCFRRAARLEPGNELFELSAGLETESVDVARSSEPKISH